MRLARKLILAVAMLLVSVLAVNGYLNVRRELEVFETDMHRDHAALGLILEREMIDAWRRGGRPEALRMLSGLSGADRARVRWLEGDAATPVEARGQRATVVPVLLDGRKLGSLQISESVADERVYIRRTILRTVLVTGLLALGAAVIVFLVTMRFVGRPIQALREKTRRIGRGDLGGPLHLRQHDEMAELAEDVNEMCDSLAGARQRIDDETEARMRALEQLRHADRLATIGTLASGIAHELGTPLGVVLARARMIEERELEPDDTARSGKVIADQVERISRIIRQLLDFARGRRGLTAAEPIVRERAELEPLIRAAVALVQPLADRAAVRLTVEPSPPVGVRVDAGLIQQVLLNLLMNAVQATTGPGQVRLSVGVERVQPPADLEPPASEAAEGKPEFARFSVADDGAGIAPEVLPHIFEPFFTTKEVGMGTGLGLSVSYGIVREHGGWMAVDSQPGRGSRFHVYLPFEPAPSTRVEMGPAPSASGTLPAVGSVVDGEARP